jgi:phosphatidylglycerophosphate synthase
MSEVGNLKRYLPSIVTGIRILLAPAFYFAFLKCSCSIAFAIFALGACTDAIDGRLARKFEAVSAFGAYFDAIADFILIMSALIAFIQVKWYCYLLAGFVLFSFFSFIVTSGKAALIYDPVGKYFGTVLIVGIATTLIIPYLVVRKAVTYSILAVFAASQFYRYRYLLRRTREMG